MKIVFIEPRMVEANVYSRLRMPLLGPVYLGTILKRLGHEVEIYNENIFEPDYSRIEADLIGISILTATARRGYRIASYFPRHKVIIGGVHASLLPEEALPYCRQVVVGEAEEVIAGVVEGRLRDPIVRGHPVEDLDSLPFPEFSLIKGYDLSAVRPVSTSRGCPFDCSFCSVTRIFGRKYRFRSPENILREMLPLGRKREVFFCDDNFCADVSRSLRLAELLRENGWRQGWSCQARCDSARDGTLLARLASAGCRLVCVGLESVNENTLKQFDKRQTVDDISHAIEQFHKNRIRVHGMFVLGGNDDNSATVRETLEFAVSHRIDTLQMSILTPFPGTRVYRDLSEQRRIFSENWDLYDGQHIVFNPRMLSPRELQSDVVKAYREFYSVSNALKPFFRRDIRNAFFRFMGHSIIRQWIGFNKGFPWIPAA